ncbi:MAG: hypothetical protein GWQ05_05010 [Verrucomicrobiaceae bacterium]|jgi:thiol-disulfide isomerase/thioredoxin|nr:hypothetical protein [Verrucomicrobiales bacterium]MDF1789454.1 hypothetical protein [Verrucomicrobiales bacterium]NCF87409.1 hypothetical protein [Verrucomicrobiaceae bacterium]NCF90305.1 hypothetical protein [Verrucomicrobiaceae bacterium]
MDSDHLDELLKAHYETSRLADSRVCEILGACVVARSAYRWKRWAIGATALATAAVVSLAFTLMAKPSGSANGPEIASTSPNDLLEDRKLVAVMIHAKGCANSEAMDPVFAELQREFVEEPVLFIKFDYSSDCAVRQAELLSHDLGLDSIFNDYKRTGNIVLVSSKGAAREVVDTSVTLAAAADRMRHHLAGPGL